MLFKHATDTDWRALNDYEVQLRKQKPETLHNMTVYPQDFDDVAVRLWKLPAYLGRNVSSLESLAYGTRKSPLLCKPAYLDEGRLENLEGEVLSLKFRAAQFGQKIYQVKANDESQYHYIHTHLSPKMVWFNLYLSKVISEDDRHKLEAATLPISVCDIAHLESFDFSTNRAFDDFFEGNEFYVIDTSLMRKKSQEGSSGVFLQFFWGVTQAVLNLQGQLGEFDPDLVIEREHLEYLIARAEKAGIDEEYLKEAIFDQAYFDKLVASALPLLASSDNNFSQPHKLTEPLK